MPTESLYLFIGASGKQCSHIIPHFYPHHRLRLVVRSTGSLERLQKQYPLAEVVQADISQPAQCHELLKGVTSIYYTGPTYHPHEATLGFNVIDAAVAELRKTPGSNFKHFVYSSAHCSQLSKMLNHARKRDVEEYLMESPLNWTILQPTHFGDASVTRLLDAVRTAQAGDKPCFKAFFNPACPFAYAFLKDHGEAAAKVLREREKHYFATYDLCSTETMSYSKFASRVGSSLPKPVSYDIEVIDYSAAVDILSVVNFGTKDVDQRCRDAAERMLLFYDTRGLPGNPNVLEWLLGKKPTSIGEVVKQQLEEAGV